MKILFALLLSIMAVAGCNGAAQPIDTTGLDEASRPINKEHVKPFLIVVSKLLSAGFTPDDAAKVSDQVDGLRLRQSGSWEFSVTSHDGKPARLVIAAYKSDLDAPEIYSYSSPEVIEAISYELVFSLQAQ